MTTEHTLSLRLTEAGGDERDAGSTDVTLNRLIIAGWTGRDTDAMEKHIKELEELGVARPASTPIFYRASVNRLTTASAIQASGTASSGEIEFALLRTGGRIWVGAGSDHTDREVETYGVTVSKQMCDKPVASVFWAWDDVAGHWDDLALESSIVTAGKREVYQQGTVAAMRPATELIEMFEKETGSSFQDGDLMLGGTLAAMGGIRPADRFEFRLHDPERNREIAHAYDIEPMPVLG